MNQKGIKRIAAGFLTCLMAFAFLMTVCYAADRQGEAAPDNTEGNQRDGTDVWAGVIVQDYLVILRYEVTDTEGRPLAGVAIEHWDKNEQDYFYVGTTDENGVWETQVAVDYVKDGILGQDKNVTVVESSEEQWKDLTHRLTKNGYITVEGPAQIIVSRSKDGIINLVRVVMEREQNSQPEPSRPDRPGHGGGGDNDTHRPHRPRLPRPDKENVPEEKLPPTGVGEYWSYLVIGSLLLLLAAVIIFKILRDQKKRDEEKYGRDR